GRDPPSRRRSARAPGRSLARESPRRLAGSWRRSKRHGPGEVAGEFPVPRRSRSCGPMVRGGQITTAPIGATGEGVAGVPVNGTTPLAGIGWGLAGVPVNGSTPLAGIGWGLAGVPVNGNTPLAGIGWGLAGVPVNGSTPLAGTGEGFTGELTNV